MHHHYRFTIVISLLLVSLLFISSSSSSSFTINAESSSSSSECTFASQRTKCGQLTCNVSSRQCVPCASDEQCYNPSMRCTSGGRCKLMDLGDFWQSFRGRLFAGVLLAVATCIVASLSGAGGGMILTGFYKLVLGFALTDAVALSQATIAGTQITNMVIQTHRYHPNYQPPGATRPIINYQLLVLYVGPALGGTMFGNLIGHIIANPVRLMIMVCFFSFLLSKTVSKVQAQREQDLKKIEAAKIQRDNSNSNNDKKELDEKTGDKNVKEKDQEEAIIVVSPTSTASTITVDVQDKLSSPVQKQETDNNLTTTTTTTKKEGMPQFPKRMYFWIAAMFLPLAVSNYLRTSVVTCHDNPGGFWLLLVLTTVYCSVIFSKYRESLVEILNRMHSDQEQEKKQQRHEEQKQQQEKGSTKVESDATEIRDEDEVRIITFEWNKKSSLIFPIVATLGGVMSALAGIGIGMITSLLFIEAKITPEEMSATSGAATFLISVLTLLQFTVQGYARLDFSFLFMVAGCAATSIGQLILMPEIKRRGMSFLILTALATVMGGSLLMSVGLGLKETIEQVNDGGFDSAFGFGSYCKA